MQALGDEQVRNDGAPVMLVTEIGAQVVATGMIFARIGAVSDMYDALITDRPYRAAMRLDDVLALLNKEAAQRHLDQSVVRALEQIAPDWERDRVVDSLVESLNRSADLVRMAS